MQGPETEVENTGSQHRGLIPRILEHLFDRIAQKHAAANALRAGSLQFQVRCSYLEIYNETVTDLLDPSKINLPVRENTREGTIYVDGLTWENVSSVAQTNALLHRGVRNRYHVGFRFENVHSSTHPQQIHASTLEHYSELGRTANTSMHARTLV